MDESILKHRMLLNAFFFSAKALQRSISLAEQPSEKLLFFRSLAPWRHTNTIMIVISNAPLLYEIIRKRCIFIPYWKYVLKIIGKRRWCLVLAATFLFPTPKVLLQMRLTLKTPLDPFLNGQWREVSPLTQNKICLETNIIAHNHM